jgi:predicted metalloprotease
MRWSRGKRSEHLEDRRGQKSRIPGGAKGISGVGLLILIVLGVVFKQDISSILGSSSSGTGSPAPASEGTGAPPDPATDPEAEQVDFVSFLLDDMQATWDEQFAGKKMRYQPTVLVLYRRGTESGCGYGTSAIGPFYCPADHKVYIDLAFFEVMKDRLGAPGDFAQAYVMAHEIGHHVQNLTGVNSEVARRQKQNPDQKNALSVRQELQADCFAGVWAHDTAERDLLDKGDLDEGLNAAFQIGDDTLQKNAGGKVAPESFTHGTSEQRVRWFRRGFDSGEMSACDTLSAEAL